MNFSIQLLYFSAPEFSFSFTEVSLFDDFFVHILFSWYFFTPCSYLKYVLKWGLSANSCRLSVFRVSFWRYILILWKCKNTASVSSYALWSLLVNERLHITKKRKKKPLLPIFIYWLWSGRPSMISSGWKLHVFWSLCQVGDFLGLCELNFPQIPWLFLIIFISRISFSLLLLLKASYSTEFLLL